MEFTNPFDHPQGRFYILQNSAQQCSLWPAQCALPAGWHVICEPQSQAACNDWLAAYWQSLTPAHYAHPHAQ